MPSFSVFIVGAGGGPLETDLSAYLCKTHNSKWEDGIFALDAGSGVATLARLLQYKQELFPYFGLDLSMSPIVAACHLVSLIHTYLITHSHLDHISGLILSAGALPTIQRKRICATDSVLRNLEAVFSGHLWPKLANRKEDENEHTYLLTSLIQGRYQSVCLDVSICPMSLSHGTSIDTQEFLFFGDVEPDSLSVQPRTFAVWKAAAPLIPHRLRSIFIECSWPMGRMDEQLYGHLSPPYVAEELEALTDEIMAFRSREGGYGSNGSRTNALAGLTLYITHCKADLQGTQDQSVLIADQIRSLVSERNLGIEVVPVAQGMCIEI